MKANVNMLKKSKILCTVMLSREILCCCIVMLLLLLMSVSRQSYANNISGYLLRIQLAPAVCSLDPSQQKQRKCLEGYSLVITGLYPETTSKHCDTQTLARLPPLQARAISRVMPSESERQQLWQRVGGCISGNASQYFRIITTYAERLTIPPILTSERSYTVQRDYLLQQLARANQSEHLSERSIRLTCRNNRHRQAVLTEVQICYAKNGQYKSCSSSVANTCPSSFIIEGSY